MSKYKGNIHVRVSRVQQECLRTLSAHYNTSVSQIIRFWISQSLVSENQKGTIKYQVLTRQERGY
jgi:hypothetical protein